MPQQLTLDLKTWGGRRRGSGRKRVLPRPSVAHRSRPPLAARFPVHVTIRLRPGLPELRARRSASAVLQCLAAAAGRFGSRIVHYSIQRDHLHLLMEAPDMKALQRAAKGLSIRIARACNRLAGTRGIVVPSRYDTHILTSPLEVKRAIVYVLQNARKHLRSRGLRPEWDVDPYSSARAFDGWSRSVDTAGPDPPVDRPRTWLLSTGWRRHGPVSPSAAPA